MDVFFIYGLVDIGDPYVVRYIGQTHSLIKRIKVHRGELKMHNGPAAAWKWSVIFFGRDFDAVLLDVVYGSRKDALVRERTHIEIHEQKTGRLMNGDVFWKRQKQQGVPNLVAESQIRFIQQIQAWCDTPVSSGVADLLVDIAESVDRTETEFTSLQMGGRWDSFKNEIRDRRKARIRKARLTRQALADSLTAQMIYGS